ncbi:serine racemase VanT catalytic subunit [Paenibacillus chibensis]|uniref:Alanine racemase n=1 Tax=Paenibacillus chibensis TaxID=59846 RepID=A0ABU6PZT5_9BACL|nr:serine racemase VanT catalytic subunit [Paenibacillus chibensis]
MNLILLTVLACVLLVLFPAVMLLTATGMQQRRLPGSYCYEPAGANIRPRYNGALRLSRYHSLPMPVLVPVSSIHPKAPYTPIHPSGRQPEAVSCRHRAWAEIHLGHLRHNAVELQRLLSAGTRIMAVIKADAYGHGSVEVAQTLNRSGIRHFAVAEIGEGIRLRQHGIQGEILILGYTSPELASMLAYYRLTQTLVSREYGESLESYGAPIHVHVKIDTGMNRLGEPYEDLPSIRACYRFPHLQVTGTFSHLSMSGSLEEAETDFTREQFRRFNHVIGQLKLEGVDPGQVHIQSSYGILNYPVDGYDLVRPGIALYGLLSQEGDQVRRRADLRPVLTLKAAVTQVKEVEAGHPVGYGRDYVPFRNIRIATVSIGYADGIPRSLSEHGGCVLVRGQRASIIGSICMDQLTLDVTSIDGVRQGDTVTLIGQDGEETITASEIAGRCGTVTNEILSRLGSRVKRVYVEE